MTQKKRDIVGNTPCFRCKTFADVRQGRAGFLYTHCKICGDNFSRSAGFQQKTWAMTEFTVPESALNLAEKPEGLTIKENIYKKITPDSETKNPKTEPEQKQEQEKKQEPTAADAETAQYSTEEEKKQLSAIISNNVLLYKEEAEEKPDFIECDEVAESSASRVVIGVGGITCLAFFLLKLFV